MSLTRTVVLPYNPRKEQLYLHKNLKRYNVVVTHRRLGKTVFALNHLIRCAVTNTFRESRYFYIAPFRTQAKTVAWSFLKFYAGKIPGIKINESELYVEFPNNSRITLFGSDNYTGLRGTYFDGGVLDEFADIDPLIFEEILQPALLDRKGFVIFTGTPHGLNHFYDLYKKALENPNDEWFYAMFKATDTDIIDKDELNKLKFTMSEEQFNQEFMCDFSAANQGAYYSKQLIEARAEKRVGLVSWNPDLPVYTFWDLGVSDTTCIWFAQRKANLIRVIDYYENCGESLSHYINYCAKKPYIYDVSYGFWGPHDLEVREFAAGGLDVPKTRRDVARSLGVNFQIAPNIPVVDGIEASRRVLKRCIFDSEKCDRGLKALENYSRVWDAKNKMWKDYPLHNWASNGSDAFRYLAVSIDKCLSDDEYGWNSPTPAPDVGIV